LRLDVHHVCVIIERENNRVTSKCEQSVDLRNELRLKELRPCFDKGPRYLQKGHLCYIHDCQHNVHNPLAEFRLFYGLG
jgi:hypothetical protein